MQALRFKFNGLEAQLFSKNIIKCIIKQPLNKHSKPQKIKQNQSFIEKNLRG